MKTNIRVNNTTHELSLDSRVTLLDALHDVLDLTGTKKGCDQGACGACTVRPLGYLAMVFILSGVALLQYGSRRASVSKE